MKWFLNLLFLYRMQYIHSQFVEKIKHSDDSEVNTFLEKILQSEKFDELADRIADRAVRKLNDLHKFTVTEKIANDVGLYRSQISSSPHLGPHPREPHKHKHGKIDVEAVLKKAALPFDDLKLRYKHLKNKHAKSASNIRENDESMNAGGNDENDGENNEMRYSQENSPQTYHKVAQDVKLDFDHNIKTLSDEKFNNPYGDGVTISWSKKTPQYPQETKRKLEGTNNFGQINQSQSRGKYQNYTRTTRTEGDKQFILEDHPDYEEYNQQLAYLENINSTEG